MFFLFRFKATASAADNKPSLVDLTDSSNNKDVDADLEKAIQLSLQEVKRPVENFGVSQEDQDVSRALEASLLENQNKRSGMMIDYVDPLNPHDRERHGMVTAMIKYNFGKFLKILFASYFENLISVAGGFEKCWSNLLVFGCDPIPVLHPCIQIFSFEFPASAKDGRR